MLIGQRVAVGGVGGSGTRVVARILERLGYFTGHDVSEVGDNLLFSLLFRRPIWYRRMIHENRESEIEPLIDLFYRGMKGETFDQTELATLDEIYGEGEFSEYERDYPSWYAERRNQLLATMVKPDQGPWIGWGWKEPNTHIYVQELGNYDAELKYIHVIRNGLDMAWSENQSQFRMWGFLVDVETPLKDDQFRTASLDFWIKINQRTIRLAERHFRNRFLLVHFDKLVCNAIEQTERIIDFLGLQADPKSTCQDIKIPISLGRYRDNRRDLFHEQQIEAVRHLGFDVN